MGASQQKQQRAKQKNSDLGRWVRVPRCVVESLEYRALSYSARSLLFDIAVQTNGKNNGKLVACDSYLKPLGWTSNGTISKGLKELLASRILIQTRQGMKPPYSQAAWFAIGWLDLDVTMDLDIDPKNYRRFKTLLTPKNGVQKCKSPPENGVAGVIIAPKTGVKMPENDEVSTPKNGEYLDIPSALGRNELNRGICL